MRSYLLRLFLGASLLMLCVGCAPKTNVVLERNCPRPNLIEEMDYGVIVAAGAMPSGEDRPAVQWMGRVIGWCWPAEAEAARDD